MEKEKSLRKKVTEEKEISQEDLEKIKAGVERVKKTADLMDKKLLLDPLIGLIPVVGDKVGFLVGLYIMYEAHRIGVPCKTLAKMLGRSTLDLVLGLIPGIGDIADFLYKSNRKNAKELLKFFQGIERQIETEQIKIKGSINQISSKTRAQGLEEIE